MNLQQNEDSDLPVISQEAIPLIAGFGVRIAVMAFAKLWDSSGQKHYSRGIKLHREAQKNSFKYGLESAIKITDKTSVAQYLNAHAEDKFKNLFNSVRDLINKKDLSLMLKNDNQAIAQFIAEDIASYPHIRSTFKFKVDEALVNTSVATNYDKFTGTVQKIILDKNYGPFNAVLKDWSTVENRVQSLYKVVHDLLNTMVVRDELSIEYTEKNLSALSLIESQFSDRSFFQRKSLAFDGWIVSNILPALTSENAQAKEKIGEFYKDVADTCKEVVSSNNIVAGDGIRLINKYHEEIINLTKSKDFKIR